MYRTRSNFIWLGDGVTMTCSTQADFDFINARLRAADYAETQVFDGGRPDALADMERSWTIRDGANVVGFVATKPFADESLLSRRRFLVQLTTEYVWRIKVKYVRFSRAVLRAVVENAPAWVEDFYTLPMKSYEGAVRWDERVLRMRRVCEVDVEGVPHVLFGITRKEALAT